MYLPKKNKLGGRFCGFGGDFINPQRPRASKFSNFLPFPLLSVITIFSAVFFISFFLICLHPLLKTKWLLLNETDELKEVFKCLFCSCIEPEWSYECETSDQN